MTRPQTRERLLRWVAVPALAAVLVGLAVLQYRWSGQVSDATRAQMLGNLRVSLTGFRQDFSRELGAVAVEVRSAVERSSSMKPADLNEQFHNLEQRSAHPNLVSHIYLWQDPAHQQPVRFDPTASQFERVAWPDAFNQMQQRLLEIGSARRPVAGGPEGPGPRRRGQRFEFAPRRNFGDRRDNAGRKGNARARGAEPLIPWAIDQSIPALAYPIRRWGTSPGTQPEGPPEITWLVIELNPNVLRKEIFPELAQKYFGGSSGMEYYVAVRAASKDGEQVLYSSGAGFGEEQQLPVDATLNLVGPPFGQG